MISDEDKADLRYKNFGIVLHLSEKELEQILSCIEGRARWEYGHHGETKLFEFKSRIIKRAKQKWST